MSRHVREALCFHRRNRADRADKTEDRAVCTDMKRFRADRCDSPKVWEENCICRLNCSRRPNFRNPSRKNCCNRMSCFCKENRCSMSWQYSFRKEFLSAGRVPSIHVMTQPSAALRQMIFSVCPTKKNNALIFGKYLQMPKKCIIIDS